ncbi:glycoside hydrolase family 1 protein [Bradyrhizobium prioriisuperbiae]|uniref:glycoside hydrolase family 1 protein n=1 Tax=Bradyrhizobium prioriisuperbiae TaxID=2854389 RepID=UPI0028E81FD0|nr:family 1 glycosylhydrolase [Bradyrhizobium prioritasuperba]
MSLNTSNTPLCNRRIMLQALGLTVALPSMPAFADKNLARFSDGFVWGVAASAPQTESRAGRGRSNWDTFADTAGAIEDGSTNSLCTEFDQRYPDDLALLADAGIKAFRFSISWPRIQPDGPGTPNVAGLAFYDRLVDAMLERGIAPWPTIFHWDVPVWAGDFRNREIAQHLADYAAIVAGKLGDRVHNWIVLNEPNSVALQGYGTGVHAPGLRSAKAVFAAIHHQNLGQGLALQAMRAALPAGRRIGTTINVAPVRPEGDRVENEAAARLLDTMWNKAFLDPLYGKGYPSSLTPMLSSFVQGGDLAVIATKPDFLGVNYYTRIYARAAGTAFGVTRGEPPANLPRTAYFHVEPDGLIEVLMRLHDDYDAPDLFVTETGFALDDPPPLDGVVEDRERIGYLASYLSAAHAAQKQGARLKGLFYWSATDNWEWGKGFTKKFGLIHVDMISQKRTPKRSLAYYANCIRHNAVT